MINMIANTTTAAAARSPLQNEPKHEPVDLYADLFAALFSVPVTPSAPVAPDVPVEQGAQGSPGENETAAETQRSTSFFVEETAVPFAGQDQGELVGSLIGQRTGPNSSRDLRLMSTVEEASPEFLGLPVKADTKDEKLVSLAASEERQPMPPAPPCEMPAVREKMRATGISAKLDPETDVPVDVLTLEDADKGRAADTAATGIELFEVPKNSEPGAEQPIEVLEVSGAPAPMPLIDNEIVRYAFDPVAPVRNTRPPVEIAHERSHRGADDAMPSLLDTFAANVVSEAKVFLAPKWSSSAAEADPAEAWLPDSSRQVKIDETDSAADFGFDTNVDSRSEVPKPAPFQLSDVKVRRILFDQVGTQVMDFALRNTEISDKQSIKIRLKPEELGTVEITLAKGGDGTVEAHFHTDNPQTQHLLNETLAQLRESLENSGIKVGSLETSCSSAFDNGDGAATDRESQQTTERTRLRTTFDEPPVTDRSVTDRLLNLRA